MKKFKKNKKILILVVIAVIFILSGIISWNVYFSKYKIFNDYEKQFTDTVKQYYSMNQIYLPKNNETREITLQQLYDGNHITDLYIPKTKKLCDSNSWVRVYNDNGNYKYTTYLKCGKFESNVDHIGPEITLNGDKEIVMAIGSEYKELGVNKVYDNVDGNLDTKNVIIDSSNVDVNKTGTYTVTYTIRDKAYNKTVITRKITVAHNLTNTVKQATDETNYYRGLDAKNYLLFSGMLWRIVNVNNDGTIKIISQNNISNLSYAQESINFDNSNIKEWLNNYFYSKIHDKSYLKQDNNWCIDNINSISNVSENCNTYSKATVGLLSLYDYKSSISNSNNTYLNSITEYWLLNRKDNRFSYIHLLSGDDTISTNESTNISGVRPVLVLKNDLYLLSGDGSINTPYRIGDYNIGKENDLLNTRLIGEQVLYFGMGFRIADIDDKGYTKLISTGYLKNNTTGDYIYSSYDNEQNIRKFNPNETGNIGYQLNNKYLDFIDDSLIVSHEFTLPIYEQNKKYSEFKTESFKTKISIPATYELFSATNEQMTGQANYWLIDYIDGNKALMINSANGKTFTIDSNSLYTSNGFKITFYVDKNVKIKSGNGTSLNPYVIK